MPTVLQDDKTLEGGMEKRRDNNLLTGILRRMFSPMEFYAFRRRTALTQNAAKVNLDAELKLYSEMFPSGFLHYGYFKDPNIDPRHISFGDLDQAQTDYAENLISLITNTDKPVLDVGCGTGGISEMISDRGMSAIALTPDRHQVEYIKKNRPQIEVIESKFEDMDTASHKGKYGTLLTSESLQYLDLEVCLPKIQTLLAPGGTWVACDYFCLTDEKSSGHNWEVFTQALEKHGFKITHNTDITDNILPTLKFASLLGQRMIFPTVKFAEAKLLKKAPRIYYLLEGVLDRLHEKLDRGSRSADPEKFKKEKRYVTLVMERV